MELLNNHYFAPSQVTMTTSVTTNEPECNIMEENSILIHLSASPSHWSFLYLGDQ